MADAVEHVLAAAAEGQAQSLRYIEQQLSRLHAGLAKASSEIQAAVRTDTKQSVSEVELQYALALTNVASFFSESNFEVLLRAEYTLARSENAPNNRAASAAVYIVPSKHSLVFSCVTAVAAAIAAGSCVIVELPRTLSATSEILSKVLSDALSRDTFTVVDKRIDSANLSRQCIRLFGSPDPSITPSHRTLTVPSTRSIAYVDRHADMEQAASSILRARFSFGGQTPIAPHLVLVNEYRVKEFSYAIAEKTSKYFAQQLEMNDPSEHSAAAKARAARTSSLELDKAGAQTILSGSRGTVVRVNDRKSSILMKQINEPLLIIHPITSIDDAIDFVNSTTEEPLAALHTFGSPEVAKYVSQFINAHLCCVNDIPVELLVAPLTPIGFATQLSGPYRKEMFSMAKPEFIRFGDESAKLSTILDQNDHNEAVKLRKQAQNMDTAVKQPAGHAVGYFEQGLIVGGSVALTMIISSSVLLFMYGVPAVTKRFGR